MGKPLVFVTRRIPEPALNLLREHVALSLWDELKPVPRDVLLREVAHAEGLITMLSDRVDAELLNAAPRLRVVANMAVGYDNIDLHALTEHGVVVTNTPDVLTEATADMAWALLLAAARRVVEGHKVVESGRWETWHPFYMLGQEVHGATLGVVGAGRIGAAVMRRGLAFHMRLQYYSRRRVPQLEAALGATYCALDDLLRTSDFVVVTVPLTEETRGMFGAREFALMKDTAVFVNVARGGVVKEAELVEALRRGRPWAAGLDVFAVEPTPPNNPLLSLPNVVATPHVGSATLRTRTAMAVLAARNVIAVLSGQPPLTPVNVEVLKARDRSASASAQS
ncbi:MAG: D-glycerate dehydrogenase [Thermoflexales bacterium]|nr:D-glycerate dehydrogenase [Thermoflexales bacterium]MCS7325034.1 D-glycerate dehydrogenase [Thermoflexales bacterium]MCX7939607.1 D-glycerate dehydrogenase [Thermoflexales bacterium]MDW8054181.1 D-glycerate dehydrogenase [Anaerolineae bacterium]MDW8292299.1 D-glycerate dehydrogenase [Anaerolineae bacterium]